MRVAGGSINGIAGGNQLMGQNLPSADEISGQLERILKSPGFVNAGRLGPFLQYVVDATINGRGPSLKESILGVEVFGRPADYDPRTDPIVRVEARRLRARLAEYYDSAGSADPIVIDLPKGAYLPSFRQRVPPPEPELEPRPRQALPVYPALVAAILLAAGGIWWAAARNRPVERPAIAVLPFLNLSPDQSNQYFADGLTEELIGALTRVPTLRVTARSIVFQYRGSSQDLQAIGAKLGVSHILEGSVRRSGERLRISAQLVKTSDGASMWSQTFERQLADVFAIQDEISRAIVRSLRVELGGSHAALEARPTNLAAYDEYLEGRLQFNRLSHDGFLESARRAERAIERDSSYAPAHSLLANALALSGYYRLLPADEVWPKAKRAALRAIELDETLASAHAALGAVLGLHEWKWKEAEAAFRQALRLDPNLGEVHASYAIACLMPQGRLDEANREFAKSLELDPKSVLTTFAAAYSLLASRRYDEAIALYHATVDLSPRFSDLWFDMGMAYALKGDRARAEQAFTQLQRLSGVQGGRPGIADQALLGDTAGAARRLAEWERLGRPGSQRALGIARIYGLLGDRGRAVPLARKALEERDPEVIWLKIDPRFASIRQTAEFQALLRQLGL